MHSVVFVILFLHLIIDNLIFKWILRDYQVEKEDDDEGSFEEELVEKALNMHELQAANLDTIIKISSRSRCIYSSFAISIGSS